MLILPSLLYLRLHKLFLPHEDSFTFINLVVTGQSNVIYLKKKN